MFLLETLPFYFVAGGLAGLLSGLFGVGGGLIIVPILAFVFASTGVPYTSLMHMALATSLATIMCTSVISARAHHHRGNVNWAIVVRMATGVVLGTLSGTVLAAHLSTIWLQGIFALFVLAVAGRLILELEPNAARGLPGNLGLSMMSGLIGLMSSLVGIGGATLSVPFLIHSNLDIRRAIGTAAAVGMPIAIAGTLGFSLQGHDIPDIPKYSIGYVYVPAVLGVSLASALTVNLGVKLAQKLPPRLLKRLFALFLCLTGLKMLSGLL